MNKKNENAENQSLLQQFAVKAAKSKKPENKRAVIYNRCSSEKQDSLEWQEVDCMNLAKELEFDLIKSYGVKESAETDDRKVFLEMLAFCDKENIGHIIVHNYDRFTRSGDVGLIKQLREKGIRVHSVKQKVDVDSSSGQFSQGLFVLFAKWENDQRRDRIILGQKNKLRQGGWIGKPTVGYSKAFITGKKEHILDKPECFIDKKGQLIQQAFHWVDTEKISHSEVIDRLKKMGLSLTLHQLARILRNPFYCGYVTNSLLDGEIIRGKHEPLVSEEVFLRVNGLLSENTRGWNVIRQNEEMPLKASVRCGKCNRALTAYPQKGKYIYYKCPNNGCCVNINNHKLHALFEQELSKYSFESHLMPSLQQQLELTYWNLHKRDTSREKPMKDELARLRNELEAMEMNLAIGKLPPDLFQKHSIAHKAKIELVEQELGNLTQDTSNLKKYIEKGLNFAHNSLNIWLLSNYHGKVKVQNLLFPDGLTYHPEFQAVRTPSVNPILSAIRSISTTLQQDLADGSTQNPEKYHSLYLMFASSNLFFDHLANIDSHMVDLQALYPMLNKTEDVVWEAQSQTGTTADFNFSANTVQEVENPIFLSGLNQSFLNRSIL